MDQNNRAVAGRRGNSAAAAAELAPGYHDALKDVLETIRSSRLEAAAALNHRLAGLYWRVGELIAERQRQLGWGKSVVDLLAIDIQRALPGVAGFSARNVRYMRTFYLAWKESDSATAVAELEGSLPLKRS